MNKPRLLTLTLTLAIASTLTAQNHRPIAFTNARIVTISGDTIERGTLVVRHGKIEAIGADVAAPAGARIIDATGKTIMPGLVSASSRAGLVTQSNTPRPPRARGGRRFFTRTTRSSRGAENKAATKVIDGLYPRQKVFGQLLDVGITSLALTPQGNAFPGTGAILAPDGKTLTELTANDAAFVQITMARGSATKKLLKDNFAKAKKIVEERKKPKEQPKAAPKPDKAAPAAAPPAAEEVKEPPKPTPTPTPTPKPTPTPTPKPTPTPAKEPPKPAAGKPAAAQPKAPAAKKDPNLELLADLLEGKQRAILAIGSGTDLLHWNDAVDAEIEFPRTIVVAGHDPFSGTVDQVVDELGKLDCTVLLPATMTTKPRSRNLIHPAKILHDAGIEIGFLIGDNPAAARLLFFRLMELVRYGLPTKVALEGITLVPAKALGIDKKVGTLDVGKDANLIVFSGEPLSPQGEIDSVWIRGRAVDRQP